MKTKSHFVYSTLVITIVTLAHLGCGGDKSSTTEADDYLNSQGFQSLSGFDSKNELSGADITLSQLVVTTSEELAASAEAKAALNNLTDGSGPIDATIPASGSSTSNCEVSGTKSLTGKITGSYEKSGDAGKIDVDLKFDMTAAACKKTINTLTGTLSRTGKEVAEASKQGTDMTIKMRAGRILTGSGTITDSANAVHTYAYKDFGTGIRYDGSFAKFILLATSLADVKAAYLCKGSLQIDSHEYSCAQVLIAKFRAAGAK